MEERIITSQECISDGLDALCKLEPRFCHAIEIIDEIRLEGHLEVLIVFFQLLYHSNSV